MTDEELYSAVKAGDLRAFDELYARHEVPLFGFLLSSLKSRADAEDVFQEAFLSTLRSKEVRFDRGATFRTWLFRVARNAMLNRVRGDQPRDRALEAAPESEAPTPPDDRLQQQRMLQALDAAIRRLPPPLAEVYQLRTTGFSYEEMAHVLDLPLGTLKSRMNRMVSVLRGGTTPVDCTLTQSQLVAYDFGTLPDADRDFVETHLLACAGCLQTYLQLKRHLARGPGAERPSEAVRRKLRADVAATFGTAATPSFLRWLWRPIPLYQGLVAAAVLAVFAGLSTPRLADLGRGAAPATAPTTPQQHIDASRSTPDTQTIF